MPEDASGGGSEGWERGPGGTGKGQAMEPPRRITEKVRLHYRFTDLCSTNGSVASGLLSLSMKLLVFSRLIFCSPQS